MILLKKKSLLWLVLPLITFLTSGMNPIFSSQAEISGHPSKADWSFMKTKVISFNDIPKWGAFNDLRQCDLTSLDLRESMDFLCNSCFDSDTKWPEKMPHGFAPHNVLANNMNPGLNIRKLHVSGIDGTGISIAMIDFALLIEHEQYKSQIKHYEEINVLSPQAEMHGAAMASLATGKTIGVAPKTDIYYIACNNGDLVNGKLELNFSWVAKAIDRVIEINHSLPKKRKIKALSISVAASPNNKGYDDFKDAIDRAKAAGIFVVTADLFETYGYRFWYYGLDRSPLSDPDIVSSFSPFSWEQWIEQVKHIDGFDSYYHDQLGKYMQSEFLLLPVGSKTFASPTAENAYSFNRIGGWSSLEPFLCGLYALACQVNPAVTPEIFWNAALETGDKMEVPLGDKIYNGKVINPEKLIAAVQKKRKQI